MKLFLNLGASSRVLSLEEDENYDSLLFKISAETGIPPSQFWLSLGSKPLMDDTMIHESDTLAMNLRCLGSNIGSEFEL